MIPDINNVMDDPNLAFLDVTWQDSNGLSALMLATVDDRQNHVKAILAMATRAGKLSQVLDMKNKDGLTAIELARQLDNTTVEKLIEAYAQIQTRERRPKLLFELEVPPGNQQLPTKRAPRRKSTFFGPFPSRQNSRQGLLARATSISTDMNSEAETSEQDIQIDIVETPGAMHLRLNRDKIPRRAPPHKDFRIRRTRFRAFVCAENLDSPTPPVKMSSKRSSHSRLFIAHQRTISADSLPTPPPQTPPSGFISSLKESVLNFVGKKEDPRIKERDELIARLRHPIERKNYESQESVDESAASSLFRGPPAGDTFSTWKEEPEKPDNSFRSSPWSQEDQQPAPKTAGVRLPPLMSLRRRTGSDVVRGSRPILRADTTPEEVGPN
ncbi:unnamed protein product, partial [Mesorhabditis spiculigera]